MNLPVVERNLSPPSMSQAPRPLQNRVDPFGELHAVAERGGMMGNRGGRLPSRRSDVGRQPLEEQALAHLRLRIQGPTPRRLGQVLHGALFPRRADRARRRAPPVLRVPQARGESFYRRFSRRSEPRGGDGRSASSRAGRESAQTPVAGAARRPAGRGDDRARRRAFAVRSGALLPWSFAGYGAPAPLEPTAVVDVLTPPSTVAALKGGYRPLWRGGAQGLALIPPRRRPKCLLQAISRSRGIDR